MAGRVRVGAVGRGTLLGLVGVVLFGTVMFARFGPIGLVTPLVVGVVWYLLVPPFGFAVGEVLVATVFPVPLDAPEFFAVQVSLLVVAFGRTVSHARPLRALVAAIGSIVAVGALLWISLEVATTLWVVAATLVAGALVATALQAWYNPIDQEVTST